MASTLDGERVYEAVYEIPTLSRARLVGRATVLSDEEAVSYMLSSDFRPDEEVVLSEAPSTPLSGSPVTGNVEWLEKTSNRLRLRVQSDGPALLVVADNWFPAWKGRVGGEEVPVLRANHSLRAVEVQAGETEVELYFDTGTLLGPALLSLLSILLALGAIVIRGRGQGMEPAAVAEAL